MKTINVSTLKAELSSILREASEGENILVMDRKTPLAKIGPVEKNGLRIIPAKKPLAKTHPQTTKLNLSVDAVALLIEDRRRR